MLLNNCIFLDDLLLNNSYILIAVVEIACNNNIQSRAKNKWLTSSRVNRCVAAGSSTSSEDGCLQPIARAILPVLQQVAPNVGHELAGLPEHVFRSF